MREKRCKRGHVDPPRYKSGACAPCQKNKSVERYYRNREKAIARSIARAKANPDARRDQQRAYRLSLSVKAVREAIARADGKCEACFQTVTNASLCVDHDHATGEIRGILCRFCNGLEGILRKQSDRIYKLQAYLIRAKKRKVN